VQVPEGRPDIVGAGVVLERARHAVLPTQGRQVPQSRLDLVELRQDGIGLVVAIDTEPIMTNAEPGGRPEDSLCPRVPRISNVGHDHPDMDARLRRPCDRLGQIFFDPLRRDVSPLPDGQIYSIETRFRRDPGGAGIVEPLQAFREHADVESAAWLASLGLRCTLD